MANFPVRVSARPDPARERPLRVALFSGNYNYVRDGANQALNRLVSHLEHEGVVVRVYSPTSPEPAFEPAGTLISIPSIRFPGRGEYRIGLGLPAAIRRDVRDFAPDIIHVSAPDWSGTAAQKLAADMGVPVVASLHTRFETYLDFYGARLIRPVIERHLARFYGRSDRVLVPNAPIAAEFAAAGLGDRTRVWGRGVDRQMFDPARRDMEWRRAAGFDDDTIALLFFGRLVREKGLAEFADIADRLRAAGLPVRPLVVGEGPERDWMTRRLPDAHLTGHLSGGALGRAIASADLFLNPSVTEAFGNVTLEAMAAGLPVVSVDVPSARALLSQRSGLFYARGDLDGAVAQSARLVRFSDQRRLMARAARQDSAGFSWAAASHMVCEAYGELLGRDIGAGRERAAG
jgi:phosphatidylinositol alpha 1,6-mannosyltransferase